MAYTSTKRCPKCNTLSIVINSNNPLSSGICCDCLSRTVNIYDLKEANLFCRTFNYPFDPDKWVRMAEDLKKEMFIPYIETVMEEHRRDPNYNSTEDDNSYLWDKVNKTWQRNLEFADILSEIASIKDGWVKVMQSKWGIQYTISEYLRLEELTNNTIRSTGTTNPLQIDTIRKIAIASILTDRALQNGEVKDAADYSKMYQTFIKSGGLEEMVDMTNDEDVISTVADLCNYLEANDFQFEFYDNVSRDVVDRTIADQQNWIRRFVTDASGIIQQEYELIADSWKAKLEEDKTKEATSKVTLEEIVESRKKMEQKIIDDEDEEEEFYFDESGLNDEYKY